MSHFLSHLLGFIPPQLLVVVSRGLQALAAPVVALLIVTGDKLGGEIAHAVSFCNILFVGNLCASFVVLIAFGPQKVMRQLGTLRFRLAIEILGFAALAALLSALIFSALESTSITNAVLLARLGPVLYVIGSALLLRQFIGKFEWAGFGLIGFGVLATIFADSGFILTKGDLLILGSTVVYALVTIMSKRLIPQTGLPALLFARNFFSAIVFFLIAQVLFGPHHFADAFYGPLWVIMVVYALVIIVISQFAWFRAISLLPPASVAKWTAMTPLLAVGYAHLINGENPSMVQLTALGFITAGMLVSNLGTFFPKGASDNPEGSVAAS